jgi:hypothetical protein
MRGTPESVTYIFAKRNPDKVKNESGQPMFTTPVDCVKWAEVELKKVYEG